MKTSFEELESPYLDSELEFVVPANEWGDNLARAIGESPFANFVDVHGTETGQSTEEMETQSGWPDEGHEDTQQKFVSDEEDVLDETEQDRSDDEPDEDDLQNSESGEAEQSIHGSEASDVDEEYAFVDESEQWIQGGDFLAEAEVIPSGYDDEWYSTDYEAISELEDEQPKGGSIGSGVASNKDSLSVTVILDQRAESDDKFQLVGSEGSYTRTLGASDAKALVAGEKILRFNVKPDKNGYKLVHHRSMGSKVPIFVGKRLQDMTKAGQGPQTVKYSYASTAKYGYASIDSQIPKQLPDRYGNATDVDKDLVQVSPVLVDLKVRDPEF